MFFTIKEASGKIHERINIQGAGGIVRGKGAEERMRACISNATEGRDTYLYEVRRGVVRGFILKAHGNEDERDVDLRGASLLAAIEQQ